MSLQKMCIVYLHLRHFTIDWLVYREPLPVHFTALHEPLPAERLCHGPEGCGGDNSGLRQWQDVSCFGLWSQTAPWWTSVTRVSTGEVDLTSLHLWMNQFRFIRLTWCYFMSLFPFVQSKHWISSLIPNWHLFLIVYLTTVLLNICHNQVQVTDLLSISCHFRMETWKILIVTV